MSRPRRNENRFYRYPMRRVSAIIDDTADLRTALDALPRAGVDVSKVHVLTGPVGARLLDRGGTGHGLRTRSYGWLSGLPTRATRCRRASVR